MIENPKKNKIYASELSIPVFKSIIKKISNEMHVAPKTDMSNNEGQALNANSTVNNTKKINYADTISNEELMKIIKANKIPDVIGYSSKNAVYVLEKLGLIVKLSGRGVVRTQSIEAGKDVIKGKTITLTLSQ
jgi:hypothetical protein